MATDTNQYRPDYAVPPGWILEERLESTACRTPSWRAGAAAQQN